MFANFFPFIVHVSSILVFTFFFRLQQLKLFRYLLFPQAITFIADLSLELLVFQNVGAAARSIETVKD